MPKSTYKVPTGKEKHNRGYKDARVVGRCVNPQEGKRERDRGLGEYVWTLLGRDWIYHDALNVAAAADRRRYVGWAPWTSPRRLTADAAGAAVGCTGRAASCVRFPRRAADGFRAPQRGSYPYRYHPYPRRPTMKNVVFKNKRPTVPIGYENVFDSLEKIRLRKEERWTKGTPKEGSLWRDSLSRDR